ncbi:la-related protein 6C [Olea europaea var. sylvestris]|uniref:la-related protein 6C n=1 Tax=Olea europaea var. sylvestris TaxID=158386 RepID=UPI000C1D554B|nr:la-related protein 6C [Olea europaea var. sylvestris]
MAQLNPTEIKDDVDIKEEKEKGSTTSGTFKFNAAAPEFVPKSQSPTKVPITGYFYPSIQYIDGSGGNWMYVSDQETIPNLVAPNTNVKGHSGPSHHHPKDVLSDELSQKIIKQVEYQFSDMSMLANEALVKQVNKDPEGFVPIAVVASTKKLKSLNISHQLVAQALRSSSKLIVSNDSKKVKRKNRFTDKDKEELQLRTVVAENLPDNHSHQNIEKIFNVVGSVKTIRICQPQEPNSSRSKSDSIISHKLHALIEYENTETAEKAAEKLNDERNWRKGLRVRCLLRRSPKSVLKNRKSDFDGYLDDEEAPVLDLQEDSSHQNTSGSVEIEENSVGSKQTWARGRGKSRQRTQLHSKRSLSVPSSQLGSSFMGEVSSRQTPKGPRMPDGTRGFTMGRGKPISVPV